MLEQTLAALAMAGGTAVVEAAGTDLWGGFRDAMARWFGRGDDRREQAELERLDRTAAELECGQGAGDERARVRQEVSWQTRIESLLEDLDGPARAAAAEDLRALLTAHGPQGHVTAAAGGLAVGGDLTVRAETGSIAAGVVQGAVRLTPAPPRAPRPATTPAPGQDAVYAAGNSVAIGSVGQVVYQQAPRSAVNWPHQVGIVPRAAEHFRDRAALRRLQRPATDGAAIPAQVLAGAGGVGKTQLAAQHARALFQTGQLDLLVWVTATTRSAIVEAYAQAAEEVLGADPADPERATRKFLTWLEPHPGHPRWLVVLDDVADPADLRGLWPPVSAQGFTLVTTRRRDAALSGTTRRMLPVDLFTPEEAATYLATALADHAPPPAHESRALAADLGYLPLALSQAAAYLIDAGMDIPGYRRLLADRAHSLAESLPDPSGLPDDQGTTVAAAWVLSVERAEGIRPAGLARPMLGLAAMLDPNGIPESILTPAPVLEHLHAAGGEPTSDGSFPRRRDAIGALRALHRLSLIDHAPGTPRAVRIHQLTQRAVRDSLAPGEYRGLARIAADSLLAAWPALERDPELAQALRANADVLARHAHEALWQPRGHPVLFRAGLSLAESGQATAAVASCRQLADTAHRRLGPDHPQTLGARHALGYLRGEAGDPAGAAAALGELRDHMARALGPDHLQTLGVRHDHGHWRGERGDAAGAASVFAELHADRERTLGPGHAHTTAAWHGMARWRGIAGDPAGAAAAFTELHANGLRALGPEHPRVLAARHALGHWRGRAGDPAGAVAVLGDLRDHMVRVLGPGHPQTLATWRDLALWRGEAGDPADAVAELTEVLQHLLGVREPDREDVPGARRDLPYWTGETAEADGLVAGLADLVEHTLRSVGPDHPHTLGVRQDLANWQGRAGNPAAAVDALTELLTDRERLLGPGHPDTLAVRRDLGRWRQ
ncbi:NB-ARC domain-containing protein [Streptomyces sp. WMMC500]|uniref:tetratricopeptide repeat protein n=1 Tax=Streptomyces sp. WMMC500 TaxID=3015154 RepID=UPI00248AF987|nr:tetratricopeptide repeat protein [Streptomyces sp. WMMC500]WBB60603.1 NB-ARC domain-containing protein [Streptomyces sp. WMMC500]